MQTANNNIIGYLANGQPIYGQAPTMPQATPRLMAPMPGQSTQINQMPEPTSNLTFVDGFIEAKGFRVAAGNTVDMWDSREGKNFIYLKSTDANGIPQKMRILQYEDVTDRFDENGSEITAPSEAITIDMVADLVESKTNEIFEKKFKEYSNSHQKNQVRKNKYDRKNREVDDYEE